MQFPRNKWINCLVVVIFDFQSDLFFALIRPESDIKSKLKQGFESQGRHFCSAF